MSKKKSLLASILLQLCAVPLARAAEAPAKEPSFTDQILQEDKGVKKAIRGWAKDLDLWLSDGQYSKDDNRTSATIYNIVTLDEGGQRRYTPRLGLKLHLPNLQKKWQVLVTNYDQDSVSRGINRNRYRSPVREETVETSIGVLQQLGDVKVEFRPLLEFRKELYTSYLLIFSAEAKGNSVSFNPELQLFGRSDSGTGEFLGLNVTWRLDSTNELTLVNEEEYTAAQNLFTTNQGLKWNFEYNRKMLQQNSVIFESVKTEHVYHLDKYILSSTFEHQVFPNVLHYEVTPHITYAKSVDFRPAFGLDLVLKIIF